MAKIASFTRLCPDQPISREECIRLCENAIHDAGREGCDAILLPELFDTLGSIELTIPAEHQPNGDYRSYYRAVAEPIPGPMTARLGALAAEYHMYVIGCYLELDGDTLYNTCVILDRQGRVAGKYRKTHLYGGEHRCCGITAGDELPVFDTDFGRIGLAICMDMYYPEIFRVLTLKGARIIFWPHQTFGPSEETVLLYAKSRALDYSCYIVGSNFASQDTFAPYLRNHWWTGRATIINPDGVILADTGHKPGLAIATFDPEPSRQTVDVVSVRTNGPDRYRDDLLLLRRPELYSEITRPVPAIPASPDYHQNNVKGLSATPPPAFREGCYYCERDEEFRALLFELCDLRIAKVFLCKDQTLPGRCTIMFNGGHYEEIFDIPKPERDLFMDDVCLLAQTLKELFGADKINYAIYGDNCRHVHYTICPKYEDKLGWGTPFVLFPDPAVRVYLTDEEYDERMKLIKTALYAKLGKDDD
ncbi:MAG: hypothetical protein IJO59_02460 [Clostridia bacterium]|nr:hypothetical protein [Clostridia bacterium]